MQTNGVSKSWRRQQLNWTECISMVVVYYLLAQAIEKILNEPQKEMVMKKCASLKSNTVELFNAIP